MASSSENTKSSAKRGGRSCVAGGPGGSSFKNKQFTEGISIHTFPNKDLDSSRYWKWVSFVRRHRPNWLPTKSSILCSVHFKDGCFGMQMDVAKELGIRNKLTNDAIPTIDVANTVMETEELSDRSRRQVSWPNRPNFCCDSVFYFCDMNNSFLASFFQYFTTSKLPITFVPICFVIWIWGLCWGFC